MKTRLVLLFSLIVAVSFVSCKKDKDDGEVLPRKATVISLDGGAFCKTPGGEKISQIPFASGIVLQEKSQMNDKKYYKTVLEGKPGWIISSETGSAADLKNLLLSSVSSGKTVLPSDFKKSVESAAFDTGKIYRYPGGEMNPAAILFCNGGVMALVSGMFTKDTSVHFFRYEFLNEGKLLKIGFVDPSINFEDIEKVEKDSSSVFKFDKEKKEVTYHITDNSFFFLNWRFQKN